MLSSFKLTSIHKNIKTKIHYGTQTDENAPPISFTLYPERKQISLTVQQMVSYLPFLRSLIQ